MGKVAIQENIGLSFYKKTMKPTTEYVWGYYLDTSIKNLHISTQNIQPEPIEISTVYPGFVSGIGNKYGNMNGYQLGFMFDYTTGLPIIPGSSIKGVLKKYFYDKDFVISELNLYDKANIINWDRLVDSIFEGVGYENGKPLSAYNKDIFFDAYISDVFNCDSTFLSEDYITTHKVEGKYDPLKNPKPLKFLKIKSEVQFTFQFKLVDTKIVENVFFNKEMKNTIFKKILTTTGSGAKTNVGYGQFEEIN